MARRLSFVRAGIFCCKHSVQETVFMMVVKMMIMMSSNPRKLGVTFPHPSYHYIKPWTSLNNFFKLAFRYFNHFRCTSVVFRHRSLEVLTVALYFSDTGHLLPVTSCDGHMSINLIYGLKIFVRWKWCLCRL